MSDHFLVSARLHCVVLKHFHVVKNFAARWFCIRCLDDPRFFCGEDQGRKAAHPLTRTPQHFTEFI